MKGKLSSGLCCDQSVPAKIKGKLYSFRKLLDLVRFEPMAGRKMKGYGILAEPLQRDRKMLSDWLRRSLVYVRTLPAKEKKAAAKRKTSA